MSNDMWPYVKSEPSLTNQQILTKAIEKAFNNAWEFDNLDKWKVEAIHKTDTVMNDWYQYVFTHGNNTIIIDAERIIFHPDFAKALWSKTTGYYCVCRLRECRCGSEQEERKHHLQMMVIADDPIKYLGENI